MKKIAFVSILCMFVLSNAVEKVTIPQRASTGAVITAAKYNENFDTVAAKINKIADTINVKIPRMVMFSNHDSTFKWMNIDTIPSADTIYSKRIKVNKARVDSITSCDTATITKAKITKARIDTVTSCDTAKVTKLRAQKATVDTVLGVDTLYGRTVKAIAFKFQKGAIDTIRNKVRIDTIANKVRIDTIQSSDTAYIAALKFNKLYGNKSSIDTILSVVRPSVWIQRAAGVKAVFDSVTATYLSGSTYTKITVDTIVSNSATGVYSNNMTIDTIFTKYFSDTAFVKNQGSLTCNMYSGADLSSPGTCNYQKINSYIILNFSDHSTGNISADSVTKIDISSIVPPPLDGQKYSVLINDAGTDKIGVLTTNGGDLIATLADGTKLNLGTGGVYQTTITYRWK